MSIIGLWHMNNDWTDSSGNGYDGTATGATFETGSPILGAASGSFDGVDDRVSLTAHVANFASLTEGTVHGWCKPEATNAGHIFVIGDASANSFYLFGSNNGNYGFRYTKAGVDQLRGDVAGFSISDASLVHFAFTMNSVTGNKLYLNGSEQTVSYTVGGAGTAKFFNDNSANWDTLHIGRRESGGSAGGYWKGLLDEISIFDYTLSADDVRFLYNDGLGREIGRGKGVSRRLRLITGGKYHGIRR